MINAHSYRLLKWIRIIGWIVFSHLGTIGYGQIVDFNIDDSLGPFPFGKKCSDESIILGTENCTGCVIQFSETGATGPGDSWVSLNSLTVTEGPINFSYEFNFEEARKGFIGGVELSPIERNNINFDYGQPFYFRLYDSRYATFKKLGPFTFHPSPPTITSVVGVIPNCPEGEGSIQIIHGGDTPLGATFTYTVTQYVEAVDGDCPAGYGPGGTSNTLDLDFTNTCGGFSAIPDVGGKNYCSGYISTFTKTFDNVDTQESLTAYLTPDNPLVEDINFKLYPGIYEVEIEGSSDTSNIKCICRFFVEIPKQTKKLTTGSILTQNARCENWADGQISIPNLDWREGTDSIYYYATSSLGDTYIDSVSINSLMTGDPLDFQVRTGQYTILLYDGCADETVINNVMVGNNDAFTLDVSSSQNPKCQIDIDGLPGYESGDGFIEFNATNYSGASYSWTLIQESSSTNFENETNINAFTGLKAETYSASVRVESGSDFCTAEKSEIILEAPGPITHESVTTVDARCTNWADGLISIPGINYREGSTSIVYSTVGGPTDYSGTVSTSGLAANNTLNLNVLPGAYTVTLQDGCGEEKTITGINVDSGDSFLASIDAYTNPKCLKDENNDEIIDSGDGSIAFKATPYSGANYFWSLNGESMVSSGTNESKTFSGLLDASYSASVRVEEGINYCVKDIPEIFLSTPPDLQSGSPFTSAARCSTWADGEISIPTIDYREGTTLINYNLTGLTNYQGSVTVGNLSANNTLSLNVLPGTYDLTLSDGCYGKLAINQIVVESNDWFSVIAMTTTDPLCIQDLNADGLVDTGDGSIQFKATKYTDGTYSWSLNGGSATSSGGDSLKTYSSLISNKNYSVSASLNDSGGNSCSGTSTSVQLNPPDNLALSAYVTNPVCSDGVASLAITDINKANGAINFSWDIYETSSGDDQLTLSSASPVTSSNQVVLASNLTEGSYKLTVIDHCNTESIANYTDALTVAIPDPVTLSNVLTSELVCFDDSNGTALFNILGGSLPFTVEVKKGSSSAYSQTNTASRTHSLSSLSRGNYTILVSEGGSCSGNVSGSFSIGVENGVTSPITYSQEIVNYSGGFNIQCKGGSSGKITIRPTGGNNNPYTVKLFNGEVEIAPSSSCGSQCFSFESLISGTYVPRIIDGNGCSDFSSNPIVLTEPTELTINPIVLGSFGNNQVKSYLGEFYLTCHDDQVSFTPVVTGGTTPYSYLLTGGTPLVSLTSFPFSDFGSGSYDLIVTDANGCQVSTSFMIKNPDHLDLELAPYVYDLHGKNVACFGESNGSIVATAIGGISDYTYDYNGVVTTISRSKSYPNLSADSYSVTVTDFLGCSATSTINLQNPPVVYLTTTLPSLTNGVHILCNGESAEVNFNASGGTNSFKLYLSSNGGVSYNSRDISPGANTLLLIAGNYKAYIEDGYACQSQTDSFTLSEPTQLDLAEVTEQSFDVDQVKMHTGNIYIKCNNSRVNLAPAAIGGISPLKFHLSGGTISGILTSNTFSNLGSGTYSLNVTDANGCEASTSFTLYDPDPLDLNLSALVYSLHGKNVKCTGDSSGSIEATASGGISPYQYEFNGGITLTSNSVTYENLVTGSYEVTITDDLGCLTSSSLTLNNPQPVAIETSIPSLTNGVHVLCKDETIQVGVNASGGTDAYTLHVSKNSGPYNPMLTNPGWSFYDLADGDYSLYLTDSYGCLSSSQSFTITEPANSLLFESVETTFPRCIGGDDGLLILSAKGGTSLSSNYTFSIRELGGTDYTESQWNQTATFLRPADDYNPKEYEVRVTDDNGCIEEEGVAMVANPSPFRIKKLQYKSPSCYNGTDGYIDVVVENEVLRPDGNLRYVLNWGINEIDTLVAGDSIRFPNLHDSNIEGPYTVYVEDAIPCEQRIENFREGIFLNAPPNLSIEEITSVRPSCFQAEDGWFLVKASGGTGNYFFSMDGVDFSASTSLDKSYFKVENLQAGSYTVILRDDQFVSGDQKQFCERDIQIEIPKGRVLKFDGTMATNTSCFEGTNGSLHVQIVIDSLTGESVDYSQLDIKWEVTEGPNVESKGTLSVTSSGIEPLNNLTAGNNFLVTAQYHLGDSATCERSSEDYQVKGPLSPLKISSDSYLDKALCGSANSGNLHFYYSGGWPGTLVNYQVDGGNWRELKPSGSIATGLSVGNHELRILQNSFCEDNKAFEIFESRIPLSINSIRPISCSGFNDGSITLSPFTYPDTEYHIIEPATSAAVGYFDGLKAGVYKVVALSGSSCQSDTLIVQLSEPEPLGLILSKIPVDCNGNKGSAAASISGGTAPYHLRWRSIKGEDVDPNMLDSGDYRLEVTDKNGCLVSQDFTIEALPKLTFSNITTVPANCYRNDGSASFIVQNGVTPYYVDNLLFSQTNELHFSGLLGGDTTINIQDSNGCQAKIQFSTESQNTLAINLIAINPTSCDATDGSIEIEVTGGIPPYAYFWKGSDEVDEFVENLAVGLYSVTVTDGAGCSASREYSVISNNGPTDVQWSVVNAYCGQPNGRLSLGEIVGGTPPFEVYLISNGSEIFQNSIGATEGLEINTLHAGSYAIKIYDLYNCLLPVPGITILDDDQLVTLASLEGVLIDSSACGQSNGRAEVVLLNGSPPIAYQWYNEVGMILPITGAIGTNLASGVYRVNVIDTSGCSSEVMIKVVDRGPPSIIFQSKTPSPENATNGSINVVSIGGVAPYTYRLQFSGDNLAQNETGVFEQLSPGSYELFSEDSEGCSSPTIKISVEATPVLKINLIGSGETTCMDSEDGFVQIDASGGVGPYTFFLDGKISFPTSHSLAGGLHHALVKDALLFEDSLQFHLDSQEPIEVEATVSLVSCVDECDGAIDLFIQGGSGSYQVEWQNGTNGNQAQSLCSGEYFYTVYDTQNRKCQILGTVYVERQPELELTVEGFKNPNCHGSNDGFIQVLGSGGSGLFVYQWEEGTAQRKLSNIGAGTYFITLRDSIFGCTLQKSYTLSDTPEIEITDTLLLSPKCYGGSDGSISLTLINAGSPLIRWSNGMIGRTISGLSAGTYDFLVTSQQKCELSGTIELKEKSPLSVVVSKTDNECRGQCNGSITLEITEGAPPYVIRWNTGSNRTTLVNRCDGSYTYTVSDFYSCEVTGTVIISSPESVTVESLNKEDVSCFGGSNGSLEVSAVGGTGGLNYLWSNEVTTQENSGLKPGTYTLEVTDQNGCQTSATTIVSQPEALLSTNNIQINPSCFGGSDGSIKIFLYGGTAPYMYNWSNGSNASFIENLREGVYSVNVTDANACTYSKSFELKSPSSVQIVNASIHDPTCHNGKDGSISLVVLGGKTPYSYFWNSMQTSKDLLGIGSGDYTLTVSDANGCSASQSFLLRNPEQLVVTGIDDQYYVCEGGFVLMAPSGNWRTFEWSGPNNFSSSQPSIIASLAGNYTLTVTDDLICEGTAATVVQISENPLDADYIRISEAIQNEPIVLLDLTYPMPDSIEWMIPEARGIVINDQDAISIELIFTEVGDFEIGSKVYLSDCTSEIYKSITITEGIGVGAAGGRKSRTDVQVEMYPNPAQKELNLRISTDTRNRISLQLKNLQETVLRLEELQGRLDYLVTWDVSNLNAGVYILLLQSGEVMESKRILIMK